jgi:hypothetical protein
MKLNLKSILYSNPLIKFSKVGEVNLFKIISFMCLATNCVTNIDQSKRENKK